MGGLSTCIDVVGTSLVDGQDEIYLLQSFGASKGEATQHVVSTAIAKGSSAVLGMMKGAGLLGILPGMMCGLVIGGVPVQQAALYQVLIAVSIALCTVGASLFISYSGVWAAFEPLEVFVPRVFVRSQKRGLLSVLLWFWSTLSGGMDQAALTQPSIGLSIHDDLIVDRDVDQFLTFNALEESSTDAPTVFEVSGFALNDFSDSSAHQLLSDSLTIRLGEIWTVDGTYRSTRTEYLRAFAGLRSDFHGNLTLDGVSWSDVNPKGSDVAEWRKLVLFLPRERPRLGGTPLQFMKRTAAFESWPKSSAYWGEDPARKLIHDQSDYLQQWGMSLEILHREWDLLSDEESYLVLVATALASRPRMLLFDEPTGLSAGHRDAVDQSFRDYASQQLGSVLLIPRIVSYKD